MRETRTHTFRISRDELRAALRSHFPDNARIATMPERFTVEFGEGMLLVSYGLTVEPTVQHALRLHGVGE